MRIDRDAVVTLACEMRDCDGNPVDADGETSLSYLHGDYGNIFPKLERALQGMEAGFELKLTLEPVDAFGEYDAQFLRVEPRAKFPATLEVGMQFEGVPGEREEDARICTVTDVTADAVVVDGNHPLAGERLWLHVVVRSVRRATEDELAAEAADAPILSPI